MSIENLAEACIPVSYRNTAYVTIQTDNDLCTLGKQNLYFLARRWESWAENAKAKLAKTTDAEEQYDLRERIHSYLDRARHLRTIAKSAYDKPRIFERVGFRVGSRVTCFLTDPDRFVSGTLVRYSNVEYTKDEENPSIKSVDFVIRVDGGPLRGAHDITIVPNPLTIYHTEDFQFYRHYPRYFNLTLRYRINVMTPSESVLIERIMTALENLHDSVEDENDII